MLVVAAIHDFHADDDGVDLLRLLLGFDVRGHVLSSPLAAGAFKTIGEGIRRAGRTLSAIRGGTPLPDDQIRRGRPLAAPLLASLDAAERREAVRLATFAIEWAARVEARAVILPGADCGARYPHEEAARLRRQRRLDAATTDRLRLRFLQERVSRSGPYLDALRFALDPLLEFAGHHGVRLALENRADPNELPNCGELARLAQEFRDSPLAGWYNPRHAFVQEGLGLESRGEVRVALEPLLLGCQLDDWNDEGDRLPPGSGVADFRSLHPLAVTGRPLLIEKEPAVESERIERALEHLRGLGLEGAPPPPCEPFPIFGKGGRGASPSL